MNLIAKNKNNLTSLWEEAGKQNNSLIKSPLFNYVAYKDYKWPNKLWFHQDVNLETLIEAKKVLLYHPNLLISYWDIYKSNATDLLEEQGFVKAFEQTGMSLKLNHLFPVETGLNLRLVNSEQDAILWSKLFKAAFGYVIDTAIIYSTSKQVNYYIVYKGTETIGTAVSYQTQNVTGMHSVGVVPTHRRKGYAEELMKLLLNNAIEANGTYVTLQASNMAKDLYTKLGFSTDFALKHYVLGKK